MFTGTKWLALCVGMEVGHTLRSVRDSDHHPSSHFLEHKEKGGLADGENACPGLHRVCTGKKETFLGFFLFTSDSRIRVWNDGTPSFGTDYIMERLFSFLLIIPLTSARSWLGAAQTLRFWWIGEEKWLLVSNRLNLLSSNRFQINVSGPGESVYCGKEKLHQDLSCFYSSDSPILLFWFGLAETVT